MRKRVSLRVAALAVCVSVTGTATAGAAQLDSVTLKAQPSGKKTKLAAVSNADKEIYITISTRKDGKWKVRDRDKAKGVKAGDGKVTIEGDQGADFKNGGEGLLTVGDKFAEYFQWNAKQGRIFFYN